MIKILVGYENLTTHQIKEMEDYLGNCHLICVFRSALSSLVFGILHK